MIRSRQLIAVVVLGDEVITTAKGSYDLGEGEDVAGDGVELE
jgi:hypothetical protein